MKQKYFNNQSNRFYKHFAYLRHIYAQKTEADPPCIGRVRFGSPKRNRTSI